MKEPCIIIIIIIIVNCYYYNSEFVGETEGILLGTGDVGQH